MTPSPPQPPQEVLQPAAPQPPPSAPSVTEQADLEAIETGSVTAAPEEVPEEPAPDQPPLHEVLRALADKVEKGYDSPDVEEDKPPQVRGANDCALKYSMHFADKDGSVFLHEGVIPLVGLTLPASLPIAYKTFEAALSTIILTPLNAALFDYAQRRLEPAPRLTDHRDVPDYPPGNQDNTVDTDI